MVWGTLEEEGRQLGQGKRVRTPRLEREQCYSPFLRQPLSRRQPFSGFADPWGTLSRNCCLLAFLKGKNQGSDQDPITHEAAGTNTDKFVLRGLELFSLSPGYGGKSQDPNCKVTSHDSLVLTCAWLQARPLHALGLSFPICRVGGTMPLLCQPCVSRTQRECWGCWPQQEGRGDGREEEKREKKRGEKAGGEEPFSSHPSLATAPSVARLSFLVHSPQAAGVKLVTTPLGALPSQGYAANS